MTKNPTVFSPYESAIPTLVPPPSFNYRFPDEKLEFDYDLKMLIEFFNHHCCNQWINKLEVIDFFKSSTSFQKAMREAYVSCKRKKSNVYFGVFDLERSKPSCKTVLFTARLTDNQLQCILLGFNKDVVASPSYKETLQADCNSPLFASLTDREKEVLARIADGHTTKEIASELYLSIHTVDSHKQKLYKKLKVRNTAELGKLAERFGLTSDGRYQI